MNRTFALTYSDEAIEHWGEFYLAHPQLRRRGITFVAFLARPLHYAEALTRGPGGLLPEQHAVQARVDAMVERDRLSVRDGAIFEALHHRQRGHACDRLPPRRPSGRAL